MKRGKSYETIKVSKKEILRAVTESAIVLLILDYYFFHSFEAIIYVLPAGYVYLRLRIKEMKGKRKWEAKEQFKELMLLASTSQRAGYSVENAFVNSYSDLMKLYGKTSYVCKLIKRISIARNNNMSVSNVFINEGEKSGIDEIKEFGYVYEIAYSHSGNMTDVMEKCARTLIEKMEIQNEIYLSLNERVFEMKIMSMMPFMIMSYIKLTNRGYFDVMYQETMGKIIMLVCMVVYVASFVWSSKIVSIEV